MIVVTLLFLGFSLIGYILLRQAIITNHEKDSKILFYSIKSETGDLLSELLYQYAIQKENLLKKHQEIVHYLNDQNKEPLNVNLSYIDQQINAKEAGHPYNIYITDKNFVIRNTTYAPDKGFNLSFAKKEFDRHDLQKSIGLCTPLFEKSSKSFLSYTDSYLYDSNHQKNGILQVSYTYKESNNKLIEIQSLIKQHPNIKEAQAFILVDTGFVNDIILKDYPSYKPDLNEILERIDAGTKISKQIMKKSLTVHNFTKDSKSYKAMYLSTLSPVMGNTKIVYSILLDETELSEALNRLNIAMGLIVLLGTLAILVSAKIRSKEIRLSESDKFIQSSMHEIKTPLSVITLNNELRQLEFGKDEYSQEIDSAIKTLKISYDDMSFSLMQDKMHYPLQQLSIAEMVNERIEYFKTIASTNAKTLLLTINGDATVEISMVELLRLIDNNLSNAIKYAQTDSIIEIIVRNNELSFHNIGEPIKDTKRIFEKYFRENNIVGGHGLGLNIVSDIAKKYSICMDVISNVSEGTTFTYRFKCHSNDISKK